MKGLIIKVKRPRLSLHGGSYTRVLFKDITENSKGDTFIFDCYEKHNQSLRFKPYLIEQAILDNLEVIEYKGKKVVSGNSNFVYLGQRHN